MARAPHAFATLGIHKGTLLSRHVETIRINAPVRTVFSAMTDLERWREWWPQIESVALPGGWVCGSELACRVMGFNLEGAVVAYGQDREIGFETSLPLGGRVTQHFSFASDGDDTVLTATVDAKGMLGTMFTRRRLLRELARLRDNVEADAGAARGP